LPGKETTIVSSATTINSSAITPTVKGNPRSTPLHSSTISTGEQHIYLASYYHRGTTDPLRLADRVAASRERRRRREERSRARATPQRVRVREERGIAEEVTGSVGEERGIYCHSSFGYSRSRSSKVT